MNNNMTITEKFFSSFDNKDHQILDGNNIIPHPESGLLFNAAGMSALLQNFLRIDEPLYRNALSAQRCIRLNDLDCVGDDTHLSGFIMLGLFSFGEYDKKRAIHAIWNFLISCVDKDRLTVTVHRDDKDAHDIWSTIISEDRIIKGYEDNFWSYSFNGPCGRCTEVFYNNEKGESIEVANIVFMEYIRENGNITKCEKMFLDVGIGMERLEGIVNNVNNVFALKDLNNTYDIIKSFTFNSKEERIICDHVRTISWMIDNQILPGIKRREYICRKLLCRILEIFNRNNISIEVLRQCFVSRGILNTAFLDHKYITNTSNSESIHEKEKKQEILVESIKSTNINTSLLNQRSVNSKVLLCCDDFFVLNETVLSPETSFKSSDTGFVIKNESVIPIKKTIKVGSSIVHFIDSKYINEGCEPLIKEGDEVSISIDEHISKDIEKCLYVARFIYKSFNSIKEYFASKDGIRISCYKDEDFSKFLAEHEIASYVYDRYIDGDRMDIYLNINACALKKLIIDKEILSNIKTKLAIPTDKIINRIDNLIKDKNIYLKQKENLIKGIIKLGILSSSEQAIMLFNLDINDILSHINVFAKQKKNIFSVLTNRLVCVFVDNDIKNKFEDMVKQNVNNCRIYQCNICTVYEADNIGSKDAMIKFINRLITVNDDKKCV